MGNGKLTRKSDRVYFSIGGKIVGSVPKEKYKDSQQTVYEIGNFKREVKEYKGDRDSE